MIDPIVAENLLHDCICAYERAHDALPARARVGGEIYVALIGQRRQAPIVVDGVCVALDTRLGQVEAVADAA